MKAIYKLICFFLLGISSQLMALEHQDPEQFYVQQMDNRNGLSNSSVNAVFQDRDKLLWLGTWDGLNMYDGTDFKVFNYNSDNRYGSIGNNIVQDIQEDRQQNIWISTIGGITRFKKSTGTFYRYFYNQNSRVSIVEKEYEVVVSSLGDVLCYSKSRGLSVFDYSTNRFNPLLLQTFGKKVIKMVAGLNGRLWMLMNSGSLICAKYSRGKIEIEKTFQTISFNNLFICNNKILVGTPNGLFEITRSFELKALVAGASRVKAISWYRSHYIIAWDPQGISTYNSDFSSSSFMEREVKRYTSTRVNTVSSDGNKVLWLGTDGNGLIKIYPHVNHFGLANVTTGYDLNKAVRAFTEENGNVWIGTKGRGILKINNFWGPEHGIKGQEIISTSNGLKNNAVFALKKGSGDYVYIGSDGDGLDVYDLKRKKLVPWALIKGISTLPRFSSVYAILQDADGSLWLGTSGSGLIHLDLEITENGSLSVKFFQQYLSGHGEGPANDIIYALADSKDGRIWIACRYGGLSVLNKKTGRFKTFKAFSQPESLSNNDVLSLYYDRDKSLWIGTSYGLNKLSITESRKEKPVFRRFTMTNGLPSNTIHAIAESDNHEIWLSTNKGLARLNTVNFAIANFRESDGLQSNEFSDGAVWKSFNGHLLFGGINGFNYFLPSKITGNTQQPNLLVSQLQMGGQTMNENRLQVLTTHQKKIPDYVLERKNNFFQLGLKSMSYLNPEKNEFSYKLLGLDKDWSYSGALGNIVYNNIPPGKYTMMVKWSNGEGVWTAGVAAFNLKVEQYIWLTYPALALYLLTIVASGYAFHVYRKTKLQMHYRLEMEHFMRQKDENEHQERINFFTNIAHEIQTPLTMIMGSIEHFLLAKKGELLKNKESNYFLSIVHQHTVRLTYLVQQLLEFRKAEAGHLKRNDDYVDLSKMLNALPALFTPESIKTGRSYTIEVQEGMAGFIDKDKFEKILFNLLSNAFKHSEKQDAVVFKASYEEGSRLLKVKVSNAGCKLNSEDLDRLFNRFYVSNDKQQEKFSTGIGLAFTKELVALLDAEIKAEIVEGWIHFTLSIPLESVSINGKEEAVITSAPSYVYESLVQNHEQPSAEDENKASLIEELHGKAEHTILLVEDEPELRYLIRNILKDQYIIYEAGTGREALNFLKKTIPDLIISDVMMPDMDGLELCAEVKNTPAMAQVPFILLSARGSVEQKTEGYEVGADAYIPKPFHINYLHVRIRKLLEYKSKMQHLIKDQHISTQFMDADLEDSDKKFLESLLKAIEKNLDEPELNAAMLEDALAISKMQLYRKLKSISGMTPAEFIKRIRLKHAADMLISSQYTVSEIIYRTGFNSKSYFFREFKKIYQYAPNDYRQRHFESNSALS